MLMIIEKSGKVWVYQVPPSVTINHLMQSVIFLFPAPATRPGYLLLVRDAAKYHHLRFKTEEA